MSSWMPPWMITAAPLFDEVTEISLGWCKWTMDQIGDLIGIAKLYDEKAVKATVMEAVYATPKAKWFVHYDHGSEYVLWGDDEQPIIDLSNLGELSGMHVYNMNCLSGKGLGPHAPDVGILEFQGYQDSYAFTNDALDEHREATGYGLIKSIKEGKDLKDTVEAMRQHGYELAAKLRDEGKWFAAAVLVSDMNNLVIYYPGAPKPTPECTVSAGIAKLLGWGALLYFRRLRQRISPEKIAPIY